MTTGLSMNAFTIGYIHFESQLRISLVAPRYNASISDFVEQLEGKKHAWYETYHHFGKRKDYLSSLSIPNSKVMIRETPSDSSNGLAAPHSNSGLATPRRPRSSDHYQPTPTGCKGPLC